MLNRISRSVSVGCLRTDSSAGRPNVRKKLSTGIETRPAVEPSQPRKRSEREEGPRGGAAEKEGWVFSSSRVILADGRVSLAQHRIKA